jgi:hypothetical protein
MSDDKKTPLRGHVSMDLRLFFQCFWHPRDQNLGFSMPFEPLFRRAIEMTVSIMSKVIKESYEQYYLYS